MPSDFAPDQTAVGIAAETGVDLQAELANFLDHHAARGTVFKDWQAGFRTWLRNAVKFGQQRGQGAGAQRGQQGQHRYAAAAATIYEGVRL